MWLLHGLEQLAHLAFDLLHGARGPVEQIGRLEAAGLGDLEPAQVDLRPEARMHGVAATNPHRRASPRELLYIFKLLPNHACHRPRAVAELQAQVVAAVAPLAALRLADQQDLVDLHAVGELVQEHGLKVDVAADGTRAGG